MISKHRKTAKTPEPVKRQLERDSRRTKSTSDVLRPSAQDSEMTSSNPPTPDPSPSHTSRRKKVWDSFRRKTQLLLSPKKRDPVLKANEEVSVITAIISSSHSNILSIDVMSDEAMKPRINGDFTPSYTTNLEERRKRYHYTTFPLDQHSERSMSDPSLSPKVTPLESLHAMSDVQESSRDDEVDSGIAVVEQTANYPMEVALRQRHMSHLQYPFFQLELILREGHDLVIKDSCGTSDPYVKFKIGSKQVYKSKIIYKNLNPQWDEKFSLPIEDVLKPVIVRVFDYDRGFQDDPMGGGEIDLTTIELDTPTEVKVLLTEKGKSDYMGYIMLTCTLMPKSMDDKENILEYSSAKSDTCTFPKQLHGDKNVFMIAHVNHHLNGVSSSSKLPRKGVIISPSTHARTQSQDISTSSSRSSGDDDQFSRFFRKSTKISETAKKLKMQIWSSVVTIVLVDGKNLLPMDDNGLSDPYVKFKLGNEKYRSKNVRKSLNPRWLEQFDLRMFDDQSSQLEMSVWDHDSTGKDDFMGRAVIDVIGLTREMTHTLDQELEDGAGHVKLLLTISATSGNETISDLANYTPNPVEKTELIRRYGLLNSVKCIRDVGCLQVKVFKAQGLPSADLGGKSDPFCVVELVNSRLQTQTEYKTLNPEWNKVFTFNVKDIHSMLEVTVYDEDRDKKAEFLGKVTIPIIKIINGERRWYTLKDKKLSRRSKGAVQLELELIYNHVKAAVRTVNPKEEKIMQPEPKFKIATMKRNIERVSRLVQSFVDGGRFLQSCFDWESKARSATAFLVFMIITWSFELYMLPITLLVIFLKNYIIAAVISAFSTETTVDQEYVDDEDDDDDDDKEKVFQQLLAYAFDGWPLFDEEKKSIKEKLQAIQDVCLTVQQYMDAIASLGERIKNTFNWTVPWLSALAVTALSTGTIILYFIPLRWLIMAWGINKFTKKLRAPNAIPNNELLDFLSRVPSDNQKIMYREFRPEINPVGSKKKKS